MKTFIGLLNELENRELSNMTVNLLDHSIWSRLRNSRRIIAANREWQMSTAIVSYPTTYKGCVCDMELFNLLMKNKSMQ